MIQSDEREGIPKSNPIPILLSKNQKFKKYFYTIIQIFVFISPAEFTIFSIVISTSTITARGILKNVNPHCTIAAVPSRTT